MIEYQPMYFGSDDFWLLDKLTNSSYPAHMHRCMEWVYVFKGFIDITCGDERYRLSAGESIMFMPNTVHSFVCDDKSEFFYLCFSPDFVPAFIKLTELSEPVRPVFTVKSELAELILKLDANSPKLEVKGLLYMLCSDFYEKTEWRSCKREDMSLLHSIILFIQEHFSEDISLSQISQCFGYDYHYLSRYLKNNLNIPFSKYLTQYRISHACFLLRERNCTITEAARLSGYSCIRSFNKSFKSVTGTTPRDYRNSSSKS